MLASHGWARGWTILRTAAVVLIGAAVVAQLQRSVSGAAESGRDVTTTIVNFFSFFTILSNMLTLVVMTWAVVWYLRRRDASPEPASLAVALASVSSYMIVTGIVYNLLLRGVALPQGATVAWSNEVLHVVGPLLLLADVFLGPYRRALPWRAIGAIVVFPIVWVAYTLIRGPLTVSPLTGDAWWYPYPFLDPNGPGGYVGVGAYVLAIAVGICVVGVFVVGMSRRRGIPAGI